MQGYSCELSTLPVTFSSRETYDFFPAITCSSDSMTFGRSRASPYCMKVIHQHNRHLDFGTIFSLHYELQQTSTRQDCMRQVRTHSASAPVGTKFQWFKWVPGKWRLPLLTAIHLSDVSTPSQPNPSANDTRVAPVTFNSSVSNMSCPGRGVVRTIYLPPDP